MALIAGLAVEVPAQPIPPIVNQVGFDQRLGEQLPLDLRFRDESGRDIWLRDFLGRRPLIVAPVYYRCPLLCNQLISGLARSLKPVALDAGKDFDVVAFSIDPEEEATLAGPKKAACLEEYDRPGTDAGWHFLTGEEPSIAALARAIGFRFTFKPRTKLYTHAAGVVIVTPDGRIARYFYGIEFPPRELKRELERARAGLLGNPIGRLLLLCYDYDSANGIYTLSIVRLMRVLGTATAGALGGFLLVMFRREWKARQRLISGAEPTG
jgi:protein SCO1/2